ncbi:hypothetical protein DV451_003680 [Geotrichum candidum]|uniref:B box-type domain-containing protein n=1 Tax=Geotrichum candidum TaxID=1173061 RepID=A0A9P5KS92_GEOCN|nr:hypothetical protein DV451_003680 [Geotrichum candidum]KAF5111096.1 hypothetical protein DV453_000337 [Geotrichum candidum]
MTADDKYLCVECGDQPSERHCAECDEDFCSVCFDYLHRTGTRKTHSVLALDHPHAAAAAAAALGGDINDVQMADAGVQKQSQSLPTPDEINKASAALMAARGDRTSADSSELLEKIKAQCKYIPVRLTTEERKLLRLLEAALNVSEYTDKVDILSYTAKSKRIITQLKEMCSILAGLVVSTNLNLGKSMFFEASNKNNAEWFKTVFEIGRRYKIMNPEKMRNGFGKLMYMIMDSRLPEVKNALEFDFYKPIVTVHSFLMERGGDAVLGDPLVLQAVVEIVPEGKPRPVIQAEIKRKEDVIRELAAKHATDELSCEDIAQCLYSIGDYHAYLRANRHPVESILKLLTKYFDPSGIDGEFSLAISYGRRGARLSHDHSKQYHYVHQSLTLWSHIMRDMFTLWFHADADLASDRYRYNLSDTGQGLNRIKPCPYVNRSMQVIIQRTMDRTGHKWIGSSVVHLGDRAVPNALFFLDKYTQVPRILTPIYLVISNIVKVCKDPFIHNWITSQFGGVDEVIIKILNDFFKHGFDGSGADNFYDAGSCIDGRLTSAWSWANQISKKDYYKVFLVCGFTGFDGSDGF